jgi:hypothetical protein
VAMEPGPDSAGQEDRDLRRVGGCFLLPGLAGVLRLFPEAVVFHRDLGFFTFVAIDGSVAILLVLVGRLLRAASREAAHSAMLVSPALFFLSLFNVILLAPSVWVAHFQVAHPQTTDLHALPRFCYHLAALVILPYGILTILRV